MPSPRLSALAAILLAGGALSACGAATVPDTATMPLNASGTPVLSDQGAIQIAAYLLGERSRTAGNPGEAARALAAVDYLAGALYTNPHWTAFPAITKVQMMQGRAEVRQFLAVAPGTPSQVVVDDLLRASAALEAGDRGAAEASLPASVFTHGPQQTIAMLTNLPYLQAANVASQQANANITFGCEYSPNCS